MARPRQISDEQILGTTRACVLEHGWAVSLDTVAEKLGVTGPALLKRFGSRQELMLRSLMPAPVPAWAGALEAGPTGASLAAQLEQVFGLVAEEFQRLLPCISALRESGIPLEKVHGRAPSPAAGVAALVRWLERARARGLVAGDELETAATAMLGAVQTNIMMAHFYKRGWSSRSQREYMKELAQLFTRALSPAKPARGRARESSS